MSRTAADTLVAQYPSAALQLRGPVFRYLREFAPFPNEQSLYMAVFYPAARAWPLDREFSAKVRRYNPGIVTVGDYVRKVRAASGRVPAPTGETGRALNEVALWLGVPSAWLRSLIAFESGWRADARNPASGARGLIQFMPKTAVRFVTPVALVVTAAVLIWLLLKT